MIPAKTVFFFFFRLPSLWALSLPSVVPAWRITGAHSPQFRSERRHSDTGWQGHFYIFQSIFKVIPIPTALHLAGSAPPGNQQGILCLHKGRRNISLQSHERFLTACRQSIISYWTQDPWAPLPPRCPLTPGSFHKAERFLRNWGIEGSFLREESEHRGREEKVSLVSCRLNLPIRSISCN